jgi:hypothetical protein
LLACIDNTYVENGRDRYFGNLPDELVKLGCQIAIIPWLFDRPWRPRWAMYRWFRQMPGRFIIPDDFYSFGDMLWAMKVAMGQRHLPSGSLHFANMNVTHLVMESKQAQARDPSAAQYIRYFRLVEKLQKLGIKIDVFIDTFENLLPEKPWILGFHQFMSDTLTVGYQHWASPAPLMLCNFSSPQEAAIAPHPDRIVCYSPYTAELFAKEGYPRDKLVVGPSLRYGSQLRSTRKLVNPKTVLVIFPLEENAAAEMMDKLQAAFNQTRDVMFQLKPHPMMPRSQWQGITTNGASPSHFQLSPQGKSIQQWLPEISCAIVSISAASIEVALSGVPLVQLGRETDFDMNVLHEFSDFRKPVYSVKALQEAVQEALSLSPLNRDILERQAETLSLHCLSPINEETVSTFIKPRTTPKPAYPAATITYQETIHEPAFGS